MTQKQPKTNFKIKQSPTLAASTQVRSMVDGRPTNIEALINSRAYALYVARGCEAGFALEDWLRAEAEVLRQRINELAM